MKHVLLFAVWMLGSLAVQAADFPFHKHICHVRLPLKLADSEIQCIGVLLKPHVLVLPAHCVQQAIAAEIPTLPEDRMDSHFDADITCLSHDESEQGTATRRIYVQSLSTRLPLNESIDLAVIQLINEMPLDNDDLKVANDPQHLNSVLREAQPLFTAQPLLENGELHIQHTPLSPMKQLTKQLRIKSASGPAIHSLPLIGQTQEGVFWFFGFAHPKPEQLSPLRKLGRTLKSWTGRQTSYPFAVDYVTKTSVFEHSRLDKLFAQSLLKQCSRVFLPRGTTPPL